MCWGFKCSKIKSGAAYHSFAIFLTKRGVSQVGKNIRNDKIVIQAIFDDFRFRKSDGSLLLTFSVSQELVDTVKPLLNETGEDFIILLKKTDIEGEMFFEEK